MRWKARSTSGRGDVTRGLLVNNGNNSLNSSKIAKSLVHYPMTKVLITQSENP